MNRTTIKLSFDGESLPTEFRLFISGWNNTENGRFLFDKTSAKSVMAAMKSWGVDLAIDLEHQMLEVEGGAADPTARDARGWCNLELRADGSLWAVNVKWTPDGARRLTEKTQRYVSPAFTTDPKTKRVLKLINVAITATPATHKTPALVAASITGEKSKMAMNADHVKKALAAMESGDHEACMGILKDMITAAASAGDEPGSEGDGAEGVSEETVTDPKVVAESAADGDGDSDEDDETKPEKKVERKAMRAMLRSLTGTKSFAEALAKVDSFRSSHMTLETERTKLAAERTVLESAERRSLVAKLVTLGAEFPSTVWADDAATAIKPRWVKMPIAELRSHVADQAKARGDKAKPTEIKPALGSDATVTLSAAELKICEDMKCDPVVFARLKAQRAQTEKAGS